MKTLLKEWRELVHNLISYIGTTDDHLASSTAALHSDSPTTSTDGTSTNKAGDQTAKQQEEEEEEEEEGGSESSKGDSEGEREGRKEEGGEGEKEREGEGEGKEGEGEGEILEYEPLPEVLKVEVEKWRSSLSYAIDSQDTQTTEKVVYMTYIRSSSFLASVLVDVTLCVLCDGAKIAHTAKLYKEASVILGHQCYCNRAPVHVQCCVFYSLCSQALKFEPIFFQC